MPWSSAPIALPLTATWPTRSAHTRWRSWAKESDLPFYVAAPTSTIDLSLASGDLIPIETRSPEELTHLGGQRVAALGVAVANPGLRRYVAPLRHSDSHGGRRRRASLRASAPGHVGGGRCLRRRWHSSAAPGYTTSKGLADRRDVDVPTPFGAPSDTIALGTLGNTPVAFLPRHGRGHRLSPTEIPARANIYALKALGVERIVSLSAVGSLQEEIRPLDVLIPYQPDRPHQDPPQHILRRGYRGSRGIRRPFLPPDGVPGGFRSHRLRSYDAHGRNLRGHGRAAILDEGRVGALSHLGSQRHRHEPRCQRPSSPVRPRSATRR